VASHGRPLRLRWLLEALGEQALAPEDWEAIVVHDYEPETAERVIRSHPLVTSGRARELSSRPGPSGPARQRNLGLVSARGRWVAFTDDDCRPEPDWLAELLAAARCRPDAVLQGRTRPDALEADVLAAPHSRTMSIEPVGIYAQTCNILYPRSWLERLGGFDEAAITGEDVDLWLRARAHGAELAAAPAAIVNHAIESHTLAGIVAQNLKWRHLAYLVKRHPELRDTFPLKVFWDRDHLLAGTGLAGFILARWRRGFAVVAAPYLVQLASRRGDGPRARAVALAEAPAQAVRQWAEIAGLAAGSLRHRTLVL
jgi:glycosyltransferase involved in cell wall biosynthesis